MNDTTGVATELRIAFLDAIGLPFEKMKSEIERMSDDPTVILRAMRQGMLNRRKSKESIKDIVRDSIEEILLSKVGPDMARTMAFAMCECFDLSETVASETTDDAMYEKVKDVHFFIPDEDVRELSRRQRLAAIVIGMWVSVDEVKDRVCEDGRAWFAELLSNAALDSDAILYLALGRHLSIPENPRVEAVRRALAAGDRMQAQASTPQPKSN